MLSVTQVSGSQLGQCYTPIDAAATDTISVTFDMYCGDGSGADGMCVNIGKNSLDGRVGEDGVATGIALCFDEWANGGDHGVMMFYNGQTFWEDITTTGNRSGDAPVSYFEDAAWHSVVWDVMPAGDGSASAAFVFDGGVYGVEPQPIPSYALPADVFLGFTGRTGGATNNHWARNIQYGIGGTSGPDMCSGVRPTAIGAQLLTFGCIDHETVQCTYNANAGGGDYDASMAAFAACRDASVGVAGYCRGELIAASGLSNQDACGGPNTNIAFHTLIPFVASCGGLYHFRFHADYGYGGFLGVDGVTHSAGDIWGHVFAEDVAVTAGDHYWEALGFEGCCDGHSELEVHLPSDAVADPWRPIISGASADLNGECEVVAPPPPPPPPPPPAPGPLSWRGQETRDTSQTSRWDGCAACTPSRTG